MSDTQKSLDAIRERIAESFDDPVHHECIESPNGEPLYRWRCPECGIDVWLTWRDNGRAPICPEERHPGAIQFLCPVTVSGVYGLIGEVDSRREP